MTKMSHDGGDGQLFPWRGISSIFEDQSEKEWLCRDLLIGPGRPTLLVGQGGMGKSLVAQAIALSVVTGAPLFGTFPVQTGKVAYMDFEVGGFDMNSRWRALAAGLPADFDLRNAPDDALNIYDFPEEKLDDRLAFPRFLAGCEGMDLVIIDALKGAAPDTNENDSSIRRCLDVLTKISADTGTSFLVLHHSSKWGEDRSLRVRGSGAIRDATGTLLVLESDGDKRVLSFDKKPSAVMTSMPTAVRLCLLATDALAKFTVDHSKAPPMHRPMQLRQQILALLASGERTTNAIMKATQAHASTLKPVLNTLVSDGGVVLRKHKQSHLYRLATDAPKS